MRPLVPRAIRVAAVPIILAWVTMAAALNLALPQVEAVGKENAVSMSPQDAPAVIAAKEMGEKFQEFTSDSIAMVVLIGEQPLSDAAHHYYDTLVDKLQQDPEHVEHIQHFWGDLIPAAGRKAAMAKPPTSNSSSPVIKAAPWATNPWNRCERSSPTPHRRPAWAPMSPVPRR
jgi:RND superfamily putative drug exporter